MLAPDEIYGELFVAVQTQRIFPDSKTFVDCTPRIKPDDIVAKYQNDRLKPGFSLQEFVLENFELPKSYSSGFQGDPDRPIVEHINLLWDVLRRDADRAHAGSSLIPLPYPYIVPGGRFGEIYYWDSYFTMLGLLESGREDIARDMIDNFAYLIETIGHVPNGNRSYFLSRSQPPFFALMVNEFAKHTGDASLYKKYAPFVEREYQFWMDYQPQTMFPSAYRRAVEIEPGFLMNRYWDDSAIPRQESYIEDVELTNKTDRKPEEIYRDLRAACESGWDFSARWFDRPEDMSSIITTQILPVDLNCLLWTMEDFLSKTYEHGEQSAKGMHYFVLAEQRKESIIKYCWHAQAKLFRDFNFVQGYHTPTDSLAMVFPLFIGIASDEQAEGVANALLRFLKPGGLTSTLHYTGQQWDAPNGWAPLQWIAYQGLKTYRYDKFADEVATRWLNNVRRVYRNTGKLVEKYNVDDITLEAGGGEYPVQDGFGWTNGVVMKFLTAG